MYVIVSFRRYHIEKGECIMTFTNKNKNFKYTVSLDTSKDVFKVFLANDPAVYGLGRTIEEAMHNLEELA